mgnify:CR=1 FL=1
MISFALEEEQRLAQDTARAFARDTLRPRARIWEAQGVSEDVARQYHALGFAWIEFPPQCGGSGAGLLTKVVALEELGWGDASCVLALDTAGPLAALLELLPAAARADLAAARERPPASVGYFWDRDGSLSCDAGRFSGTIPYLPVRELGWLVLRHGSALALIAGNACTQKPVGAGALSAAGASEAHLSGAEPVWWREDAALADSLWARLRLFASALLVGLARAAHEYALQYACERVVFGKPVAHHQAPAFQLAEMRIGLEAARAVLWRAAHALDRGEGDATLWAAFAYLEAADLALAVTRDAVQLLGGHGFLRDHLVEKWMREARALSLLWGGRDAAADDAASLLETNWANIASPKGEAAERREP